jgi:hypothetical protein
MNKISLKTISTYHLLAELLHDGSAEIYDDIEPINIEDIINELALRHEVDFQDNKQAWIEWFSDQSNPIATRKEIDSLLMLQKILTTQEKHLERIKKHRNESK